ncbi:Uncharacterized protein Fot_42543 [Forsythia ovata]|uniref:Uncharacterized protein n=1 Tax=Forsythia ovata TaxID=205694 RepID=A0ABD1RM40_9LAMI
MATPAHKMTRLAAKKESPDFVKKPGFRSKKKIISLDTPTPTKDSIYGKNRNAHNEGNCRRIGSFSSKESHKNENVDKPISDKVAQSCSSKKINQTQVYETHALLFFTIVCRNCEIYCLSFYTGDVMEQIDEIIKSAEKSKQSNTIEHHYTLVEKEQTIAKNHHTNMKSIFHFSKRAYFCSPSQDFSCCLGHLQPYSILE